MSTRHTSKSQYASEDHASARPEGFKPTGRPTSAASPHARGPEETWIAEAEAQVAMRRALMDCYNG